MGKKQKYSWFLTNEKELPYTVIHTEEDGVETIIAHADTSEKADFISKACNQFNYNQYESEQPPLTFEKELEHLINKYSVERGSDTPDFLIAEFMSNCLIAYQQVVTKRDKWFGVDMWAADKISAQRKVENQNS